MVSIIERSGDGFAGAKKTLIWAIIVLAGVEAYSLLNLYSDMSFKFFLAIMKNGLTPVEDSRQFLFYARDLPLFTGFTLGIRDLSILTLLHGIGFFGGNIACWVYALQRLRNDPLFWPYACLFSTTYLICHLGGGSESVMLNALAAVCVAILLQRNRISNMDMVVFCLAAILLSHTYELVIIFAPLIIAVTIFRILTDKTLSRAKTILLVAAMPVLLYAMYTAFVWIKILSANAAEAASYKLFDYPVFECSAAMTFLFFALYYFDMNSNIKRLALIAMAGLIATIVIDNHWEYLEYHFRIRAYASLLLCTCLCLIFALSIIKHFRPRLVHDKITPKIYVIIVMTLFFIPWGRSAYSALQHRKFIDTIQTIVNNNIGELHIEDLRIEDKEKFEWPWTYPILSILLRSSPHKAMILNSSSYKGSFCFGPYDYKTVFELNGCYWNDPDRTK